MIRILLDSTVLAFMMSTDLSNRFFRVIIILEKLLKVDPSVYSYRDVAVLSFGHCS